MTTMWLSFGVLLCLLHLGALCNHASDVNDKYRSLDSNMLLVLDVQRFLQSKTVFIIDADDDENVRITTILMSLLREFSRRKVFSMTMTYRQLQHYEEHYLQRIDQPLYVLFMHNAWQVKRFHRVTSRLQRVSYPNWLVICSSNLTQLCDKPSSNYFNVRFDTTMMVKREGEAMIREWYSIDGEIMRYQDFAHWSLNTRLRIVRHEGLYNRRYNLEANVLKIATVKESPHASAEEGLLNDLFATMVHELAVVLNFSSSLVYSDELYGSWDNASGKYHGVIGRVQSKQVDLGVGEFTMTGPRLDVVDFTMPITMSKNYLYIRRPDRSTLAWNSYFKVYSSLTWLVFPGMLALSLAVVTIIQLILKEKPIPTNYISENCLNIWGIYCQQGLQEFPTATPSRIAYFSILATSVIFLSMYSACLVSYLTLTHKIVLFKNFAEFARDGSYRLIAFYNTSDYDYFMTSNDSLLTDMAKLMRSPEHLPKTMIDGFRQVCTMRVAFYGSEVVKNPVTERIPCDLVCVASGTIGSLGMTLTKNNQYKGIIDFFLKRFRDHGIMSKLRADIYRRPTERKNQFVPVPLNGVATVLLILATGVILSLAILIVETVVHRWDTYRATRTRVAIAISVESIVVVKNTMLLNFRQYI